MSILHCFLFVALISVYVKTINAGGKLSLKFISFRNPGHRLRSGSCCDNVKLCFSSCEVMIRFCMNLQSQRSSCSLMNFETPVLGDDNFDFGASLGNNISNPVVHSFTQWQEAFKIKLTVLDDDGKNIVIGRKADLISTHDLTISSTPDISNGLARKHDQVLRGYRSELRIEYKIFCDAGYFKPSCTEKCEDTNDDTGHYTCDYQNSRKMCLRNWYGPTCTKHCQPPNSIIHGHYSCSNTGDKVCLSNYYGSDCKKHCVPTDSNLGHYICDNNGTKVCRDKWYGDDCLKYCEPVDNQAGHYNCSKSGQKVCLPNWHGSNCTKFCKASATGNFKCLENETIICKEHWYGNNCSIFCKPTKDKFNSFSCSENGRKICDEYWYGRRCNIYCRATNTSYCNENGNQVCNKNWYGVNCTRHCLPSADDAKRYFCNASGNKVCQAGWYGPDCRIHSGCIESPENSTRYYCDQITGTKICRNGWFGQNCHIKLDSSSSLLLTKNAQTNTLILHHLTTVLWAKTESLFMKTSTSILQLIPTKTLQENTKASIGTQELSNSHSGKISISESIAIKSLRSKLLKNYSKASLFSASTRKVVETKQINEPVRFSSSLNSRKATEAERQVTETAAKENNSIKEKTSSSAFAESKSVAKSKDKTIGIVPTTFVAYDAGKSEQTAKELKTLSATKSLFIAEPSTQSIIVSNSTKVESLKTIEHSQKSKTVDKSSKTDFGKLTSVHKSHDIKKSKSVDKSKDNTKSGTKSAQNQNKRMNSNTKTLLYAGIPVLVAFILFLLLILTKNSHGFRRESKSKVKRINLQPALSDPEKVKLLQSEQIGRNSVSILPIISRQTGKDYPCFINDDDCYLY